MAMCGFDFEVQVKNTDETHPPETPSHLIPELLAERKAMAFAEEAQQNIIVAADTIVILGEQIFEKPISRANAIDMLTALSGNKHTVITGVCILAGNEKIVFSESTSVTFNKLDSAEIGFYVDKYQPYDKAGAYACQEWIGAIGIKSIEGSYHNVVGLPTHRLYEVLKNMLQSRNNFI